MKLIATVVFVFVATTTNAQEVSDEEMREAKEYLESLILDELERLGKNETEFSKEDVKDKSSDIVDEEVKPWSFKDPFGLSQAVSNLLRNENIKKAKESLKSGILTELIRQGKNEAKFHKEEIKDKLTDIVEKEVGKVADILKNITSTNLNTTMIIAMNITKSVAETSEIEDALKIIMDDKGISARRIRFKIPSRGNMGGRFTRPRKGGIELSDVPDLISYLYEGYNYIKEKIWNSDEEGDEETGTKAPIRTSKLPKDIRFIGDFIVQGIVNRLVAYVNS